MDMNMVLCSISPCKFVDSITLYANPNALSLSALRASLGTPHLFIFTQFNLFLTTTITSSSSILTALTSYLLLVQNNLRLSMGRMEQVSTDEIGVCVPLIRIDLNQLPPPAGASSLLYHETSHHEVLSVDDPFQSFLIQLPWPLSFVYHPQQI